MSQVTVYKCDSCNQEIGKKPHFSLNLSSSSGIALPPKHPRGITSSWYLEPMQGFKHLCGIKCLNEYFTKKFKDLTKTK